MLGIDWSTSTGGMQRGVVRKWAMQEAGCQAHSNCIPGPASFTRAASTVVGWLINIEPEKYITCLLLSDRTYSRFGVLRTTNAASSLNSCAKAEMR